MNKKIISLNAQFRAGTIERNAEIALRALSGEPQVNLAQEFGISKQMVGKIVKRHTRKTEEGE